MHGFTYDTEHVRHEERVARSLRVHDAQRPRGRSRRLRPDPCPLAALAHWIAARRRATAVVSS